MQHHASCPYSRTGQEDQEWFSQEPSDHTCTQLRKKDETEPGVIGAEKRACTGTKARTVTIPIRDAQGWYPDVATFPTTTVGTFRTSFKRTLALTEGTTTEYHSPDYMPRRKRLKSGNGPDTDGQDSPM